MNNNIFLQLKEDSRFCTALAIVVKNNINYSINLENSNNEIMETWVSKIRSEYLRCKKPEVTVSNIKPIDNNPDNISKFTQWLFSNKKKPISLSKHYLRRDLHTGLCKLFDNKNLEKVERVVDETIFGNIVFEQNIRKYSNSINNTNLEDVYGPFVSYRTIKFLEKKCIKKIKIILDNIYCEYYCNDIPYSDVIRLVQRLGVMKTVFKNNEDLDLKIISSPLKKCIPESPKDFIRQKNANSGACYPHTSISLWRLEEIDKVSLHEFIHFVGFEFRNNDEITDFLKSSYKICNSCKTNPFEAQTEICGLLLHSIFTSIDLKNEVSWKEIIEVETCFALFQCAKLLKYFGFNSWEEFYIPLNGKNNNVLKQKTNVLSYYVLKTIILYHLNDWFNFQKNNSNHCFWDMNETDESIRSWTSLVKNGSENPNFIRDLNACFQLNDLVSDNKMKITCRMTAFELL